MRLRRIRDLRGAGKLRAEPGGRGEVGGRHVQVGEVQEREHGDGEHVQAHPEAQSHIPVQETLVPRPVHGPGRPGRKGTAVPPGAARAPVRPVPRDRQRSGKSCAPPPCFRTDRSAHRGHSFFRSC